MDNNLQENTKSSNKTIKMNLKTLFGLGIGCVLLICISVTIKLGQKIDKPQDPIKEDYKFIEWQLDGKTYDFDQEINKDITLKAVWEIQLTDEIYTITFNSVGGSEVVEQKVNGNGKVLKPENPIKTHNKFVAWLLDGEEYDFNSLVKKDITLVADWVMLPNHDVTFDSDGGDQNYSIVVFEGDTVSKPDDPVKAGYRFVEWQKDGQKYNFETPIIKDITIKAKYEENKKYTVTFKDGDNVISTQSVEENKKVTKPSDPTKANYSFAGWTLNGNDFDFNIPISGDITLIAKWSDVTICKVTLLDNSDGRQNNMADLKVKCGSTIAQSQVEEAIKNYCETVNKSCNNIQWVYNGEKYSYNMVVNKDIILVYNG